jgi:hypothetical protein
MLRMSLSCPLSVRRRKPVKVRRGRATVFDLKLIAAAVDVTVESQTPFVIGATLTGRAIPGG